MALERKCTLSAILIVLNLIKKGRKILRIIPQTIPSLAVTITVRWFSRFASQRRFGLRHHPLQPDRMGITAITDLMEKMKRIFNQPLSCN